MSYVHVQSYFLLIVNCEFNKLHMCISWSNKAIVTAKILHSTGLSLAFVSRHCCSMECPILGRILQLPQITQIITLLFHLRLLLPLLHFVTYHSHYFGLVEKCSDRKLQFLMAPLPLHTLGSKTALDSRIVQHCSKQTWGEPCHI